LLDIRNIIKSAANNAIASIIPKKNSTYHDGEMKKLQDKNTRLTTSKPTGQYDKGPTLVLSHVI
jgi:hypothetical protein